jgi:hypothetical protein
MLPDRSTAEVLLALSVAVGVTVLFIVGNPFAGDASPSPSPEGIETEGDGYVPSPVPSGDALEPTGAPPEEVNEMPEFVDVAGEVGFDYTSTFNQVKLITTSGVYVVDFDNDGYEDILAVGGENPVLFENTGDGYERHREFEHGKARAAHFFDQDNDGDRDLVIAESGGEIVFYENDDGEFSRRDVGFDRAVTSPTSMNAADVTGNGCLDLFVGQYGALQSRSPLSRGIGREVARNHPEVRPETTPANENLLFRGDCEGFTEATEASGIHGENWTLASSVVDFTGDGYPDIHVGNDFGADVLYTNNGDGTFDRRVMGPSTDRNAMSSTVADVNGDFRLDLFVTNIYLPKGMNSETTRGVEKIQISPVPEGNNLFVNDGNGTFTDKAPKHGLEKGGWGWASTIADYSNDGHLDIAHAASPNVPVESYDEIYQGIQMWKGTPDSWEKVDGKEHGMVGEETRGIARVDYDNDGRLDIVASVPANKRLFGSNVERTPFRLYENQGRTNESLQMFVRDPDGIERNAAVYVETDRRTVYRRVTSRGDFLSQDSRLLHFGTANEEVESVTVLWPDGTTRVYDSLKEGNRYIVTPESAEVVE